MNHQSADNVTVHCNQKNMSGTRKAIIIGGGPAGISAALRLQQTTNIKCTVYELRPEPTTLGGAIGIMPNGLRLLHRLGVYDDLRVRGNSCSTMTVRSLQGSILAKKEDYVSQARSETGFGYMRIKRTDLMDVLLDAAQKAKIPIYFNKCLTAIADEKKEVKVMFSDGTSDTADLLLGCDGIHSSVRRLYVDPGQVPEYSGFSGTGSIIPISGLPSSASALFTGLCATLTEEGMFILMPCNAANDELFWGFTREVPLPESGDSRDGWEEHHNKVIESFKSNFHEILKNAGGEWGDMLKQVVDNTTVMKFYPVYRMPLGGTWSRGRCLLLGDAAHAMQPHAGQGVSMALEDVHLLSRLLEDPARQLSEAFERFDQIRRPRVNELFEISSRNAGVRRKTGPWQLWLKEVLLKMHYWASWIVGQHNLGVEQKDMIYDIDEEVL
ncbi:hypothetical protein MAP00_005520 [Monascus purpureus]|nr:hypothetical protein MAP00_005520 [Monascus purpureus]